MAERLLDRIWWGTGVMPRLVRVALTPLGIAYLAGARLRSRLFDTGRLRSVNPEIPVASVGNLTAGGTGKTPVSAWIANELRRRGATPAIVMRGYGSDELMVHRVLSPSTPVVNSPSRVTGIARAISEFGSDVAVLDDAFQHRWVQRVVDIVLLGAEETLKPRRGLPAGPWREGLDAARRATLLIVTRKAASTEEVDRVLSMLAKAAPGVPTASVALQPGFLIPAASGEGIDQGRVPVAALSAKRVLVIAAVANAQAFVDQMARHAGSVSTALYRDHHAFTHEDAAVLADRAAGADRVVCTLKDFVKLAPLWPRGAPPLWYVSQEVIIERGADTIHQQLTVLLDARRKHNDTAGQRRPLPDTHGH